MGSRGNRPPSDDAQEPGLIEGVITSSLVLVFLADPTDLSGDTITYTFSEAIDPNTVLSGWNGAATSVTLRLNNVAGSDTVTVYDSTNTVLLALGTVTLGRTDYVTANRTFTSSTMVMTGSTVTITLGTASGATGTAAGTGTMTWTPSTAATDLAGNACSATAANESGAADAEF